jgi:uncharacterized membrane protein YfcA
MEYFLLFLFGCAVGVMSGLMGIGGGIALVPGLILLFHFTPQQAQGTSVAVLIPPIGIFAEMVYYQHGVASSRLSAGSRSGSCWGRFWGLNWSYAYRPRRCKSPSA